MPAINRNLELPAMKQATGRATPVVSGSRVGGFGSNRSAEPKLKRRELTQMTHLFPPVVGQLIAVGERTGNLSKSTSFIRDHLEEEVERQTNAMVGTIEPILTIGHDHPAT